MGHLLTGLTCAEQTKIAARTEEKSNNSRHFESFLTCSYQGQLITRTTVPLMSYYSRNSATLRLDDLSPQEINIVDPWILYWVRKRFFLFSTILSSNCSIVAKNRYRPP